MSLTISEQEVVSEAVGQDDNSVLLTNEDLVESVLSSDTGNATTDLEKLTDQDLEDLENFQAELDSLVHLSNVTEEVTTSEATFFDHASYSDMPEASTTLETEAAVSDVVAEESYIIEDTVVGDNVTIASQDVGDTILHTDITESASVEICTNNDDDPIQDVIEDGQYETIDNQMVVMSSSSFMTTTADMEKLDTNVIETFSTATTSSEIPILTTGNISSTLPIKVSMGGAVPNTNIKLNSASNIIGASVKAVKTVPSNVLNIQPSNIGVSQQQGSPLTIINVSNASSIKGGKQMMFIQKPSSTAISGTSLLTQGKVLSTGAGPSKSTVTTTIVPDTKFSVSQKKPSPIMVPVSVAQNSNLGTGTTMTVPVSLANMKGDMPIKFIMAPGSKGIPGTSGSIQLPANTLNLLQSLAGGGKNILTSGGQLIAGNKTLKIISAPAGTQFSTGATGTATTISGSGSNFITLGGTPQKVVQQQQQQQPTILLASPSKTVGNIKGNPQIIRAFTNTPGGKQNVMLLSPVKGKPGTFQNITLKSPQKIAPAPGSGKVTLGGGTVLTTSSSTVVKQGQTNLQKVVLRPIIPQGMKSTTSGGQNTATSTNVTGNIKQVMVPVSRVLSSTGTMQPIQVPGNKFNYVRLVSAPSSTRPANSNNKTATLVPMSSIRGLTSGSQQTITVPISTANALNSGSGSQVRLALARPGSVTTLTNSKVSNLQPRLIVPGGAIGQKISAGSFPAGSIIQAGTNSSGQPNFVMVSAQYVNQLQQSNQNSGSGKVLPVIQPAPTVLHSNTKGSNAFVPIAAAAPTSTQTFEQSTQNANIIQPQHQPTPTPQIRQMNGRAPPQELIDNRLRKPCNCTKSQCLKLYCDCFANGEFCHNCNCTNCYNNLEHEEDRQKAIKSCLDRNPMAFHPKIGKTRKGKDGDHERRHTKGCNCKRSGCLKNYCECYEAKILCTNLCRCSGCKNFEDSNERKTLMHLADAAEVRVQQQAAAKDKITSQLLDLPQRAQIISLTGERLPFSFVTQDVTDATCGCMLARAEEGERTDMSIAALEKEILEEFGRCLRQIIECSNKTRSS